MTTMGRGVFMSERYVMGDRMISGRVICSRYSTMAIATPITPGFISSVRHENAILPPFTSWMPSVQVRTVNTSR